MDDLEVVRPGEQWFQPVDQIERGDEGVSYLIKAPDLYDASRLSRAVMAKGARTVSRGQMLGVIRKGLEALISAGDAPSGDFAEYRAVLDKLDLEPQGGAGAMLSDEERGRYLYLLDVLRRHYPPYPELEADIEFSRQVEGLETLRLFVRGWRNLESDGEPILWRGALDGGMAEDLVGSIPQAHRIALELRIMQLRKPRKIDLKNSPPPSSSPSTGTSSTAAKSSRQKAPRRKARAGSSRPSASK